MGMAHHESVRDRIHPSPDSLGEYWGRLHDQPVNARVWTMMQGSNSPNGRRRYHAKPFALYMVLWMAGPSKSRLCPIGTLLRYHHLPAPEKR